MITSGGSLKNSSSNEPKSAVGCSVIAMTSFNKSSSISTLTPFAVSIALNAGSGWMSTIHRIPGDSYKGYYDKVALKKVANSERIFPKSWITKDGLDVTDDFIRYAKPLIGSKWLKIPLENGLQRYAKLERNFIEKKLPDYIPKSYR